MIFLIYYLEVILKILFGSPVLWLTNLSVENSYKNNLSLATSEPVLTYLSYVQISRKQGHLQSQNGSLRFTFSRALDARVL